jgi:Zn-dependent peptidase ImmA (M78 family)/DNA-binding XRE family transcriptional regulator
MITLARESKGLTQSELATKINAAQSTISKYESGSIEVPDDEITKIADALGYSAEFFTQSEQITDHSSMLFHRKRKSMLEKTLTKVHARITVFKLGLRRILKSVTVEAPCLFFPVKADNFEHDPETIAWSVRRNWKLPLGPVNDLIAAIEAAGGIVVPVDFETDKIDAISEWPDGLPPIFFYNRNMPWDRIRFSLAHEIGHITMHDCVVHHHHEDGPVDIETEANRFAAAFLMPAASIKNDYVHPLGIAHLAKMKAKWRTSIAALLGRARDIGFIEQSRFVSLRVQLSRANYLKNEPVHVSAEEPTVYRSVVELLIRELGYTITDMAKMLGMTEFAYRAAFNVLADPHPPVVRIADHSQ